MTYAFTAAAVVSATAAVYGGVSANSAAKAKAGQERVAGAAAQSEASLNEALKKQESADILQQAESQADKIKMQAVQMRSQMINAQTGSGAVIGEGSAQAAMDQIEALSTADALATLYSGVNNQVSALTQARFGAAAGLERNKAAGAAAASAEAAGTASLIGGFLQAGASLANGYGNVQKAGGLNTGGKS